MAIETGKAAEATPSQHNAASVDGIPISASSAPAPVVQSVPPPARGRRKMILGVGVVLLLVIILIFGVPFVLHALNTVSTDDAYVNGHFTFVAPRVSGQVVRVLVEDNNRVRKGDVLVQLDKEPYQVQVDIQKAAVNTAEAGVVSAEATVRGMEAQARSQRWKLQHAMEVVDNQTAVLRSNVAALDSAKAVQTRTRSDYDSAKSLVSTGAVAREELDRRAQVLAVADAEVKQALEGVYQVRVALGLPAEPKSGNLTEVPPDLDQTFSTVRQAQADLLSSAAQIGVVYSLDNSPKQMLTDFLKRDPEGNIDRIYAGLLQNSPEVKQARAKLAQARRDLAQAELNLRYTDVIADIDGVITRRDVNPGNNVIVGQSLMAIRSLTDIWIDANFKETQLGALRIGQPVDLHVDMYGSRHIFKGRITGFTFGTGSTLALLPAENATGNFVKVVQRLPVRIELTEPNPEDTPLFIGLSVEPSVYIHQQPTGPDAGKLLQPYLPGSEPATQPTTEPTTAPTGGSVIQ